MERTEDLIDLGAATVETRGPLDVAIFSDSPLVGERNTPEGLSQD